MKLPIKNNLKNHSAILQLLKFKDCKDLLHYKEYATVLKMNYIENDDMEQMSSLLTELSVGSYVYNGKIEAFSYIALDCNEDLLEIDPSKSYFQTGAEKMGLLDVNVKVEFPSRRRSSSLGTYPTRKIKRKRASSLSDLSEPSTQALLLKFIYMLNESFPDYDFGNVKLSQFSNQDASHAMRIVNNYLAELTIVDNHILENLWRPIDNVVNLNRCEVFVFTPEIYDDSSFTNVWSFHYFFLNSELKQLCYLTCSATRYAL